MELIGAMAIIGILAAVMAPALTDGIDRAYGAAEEENLEVLVDALERYVLDIKQIPTQAAASWTPAAAAYADSGTQNVAQNARGFARRLYIDPRFFSTTATPFPGYVQAGGLANRPISPRMMLLSDLSGNLPAPPTSAADFDAIWDQSASATVLEGPKVKIGRLNLAGRFHRLVLINSDLQQPAYSLEGSAAQPVPAAFGGLDGTLTRYVLNATKVDVFFSPFPSGGMNTTTVVKDDVSLHYLTDGSTWFWERS